VSNKEVIKILYEHLDSVFKSGESFYYFFNKLTPDIILSGTFKNIYELRESEEKFELIYNSYLSIQFSIESYNTNIINAECRPYWQYKIIDHSKKLLPWMQEFNEKVFLYNDVFWDKFYPPNKPGCNSYVKPLTKNEFEQNSLVLCNGNDFLKYKVKWDFNPVKVNWKSYFTKFLQRQILSSR